MKEVLSGMSSRSLYFDCASNRQSYRSLSSRWINSFRKSDVALHEDRQRLLELLDSMKRVHADITLIRQHPDDGSDDTESVSEKGDGISYAYDELDDEHADEGEAEAGLCDIDPLSAILGKRRCSRCVSTAHQTDYRAEDSEQDEADLSPTSTTHLLREEEETEEFSSASEDSVSPGTEGGIDGANLGTRIEIPKLQLHLLPEQASLTRRTQSAVQTLSSAHTRLASPLPSKINEQLYDQIEDLGYQICENVKSIGEKYAAQREKAEFHRHINKQLAEKYERALQETELLENELSRIRNDMTERPPVTLYSLMMGLRTPKLEEKEEIDVQQTCAIPSVMPPQVNEQKRRHFRSMSVENQAEIRFVCREPPKVTVGVGDDFSSLRPEHRRYKSMEVSRVCLEAQVCPGGGVNRHLETETCVQIENHIPQRNLLQKLKEVLSFITQGRPYGRAGSGFSVKPPCPRIICGECL